MNLQEKLYWVRKSTFSIRKEDILQYIDDRLSCEDMKYLKLDVKRASENTFDMTVFYLYNTDLDSGHKFYEQRKDWQNFADKAPCEAVVWN